ncbi:MAG: ParB/RepB/Spo0J family partition protein [Flavobacteriaceae bacterium]|nr:ParB/RepB/Spo0J family partition protein [Flavobacteriaceae bacterium]MDG2235071.1 ParB/RepB/Spo0J family partition protein [Flavobacteriaceae bacterium]|tara:strand:+ start:2170 stop:3060 length:891 start_codon:yes stop_codon:yes gene_type:complete
MAKSKRKKVLGRGLSALLNDTDNDIESVVDKNTENIIGNIIDLPLENITNNPFQPRTHFNEETLKELSVSIKELGVIQPITVRKIKGNQYELVSGERRLRASKLAGLDRIPSYVRLANDQESLEMALVENIQRQDLDPIEIGLSYQRLIDEIKLTQDQLSERVGKKRSTIANYMRLLKLDPIIQTGIRDQFITMGHGRALVNIEDSKLQLDLYKQIVKKGLSVRAIETLVKSFRNTKTNYTNSYSSPFIKQAAEELEIIFDTSVSVTSNNQGKGVLKITFESQEKLQHIINKIKGD